MFGDSFGIRTFPILLKVRDRILDEPDYDCLRELFIGLREKHEYPDDHVYDWDCLGHENDLHENHANRSLSNIKVRGSNASEENIL